MELVTVTPTSNGLNKAQERAYMASTYILAGSAFITLSLLLVFCFIHGRKKDDDDYLPTENEYLE